MLMLFQSVGQKEAALRWLCSCKRAVEHGTDCSCGQRYLLGNSINVLFPTGWTDKPPMPVQVVDDVATELFQRTKEKDTEKRYIVSVDARNRLTAVAIVDEPEAKENIMMSVNERQTVVGGDVFRAIAGQQWLCPNCGYTNQPSATTCHSCWRFAIPIGSNAELFKENMAEVSPDTPVSVVNAPDIYDDVANQMVANHLRGVVVLTDETGAIIDVTVSRAPIEKRREAERAKRRALDIAVDEWAEQYRELLDTPEVAAAVPAFRLVLFGGLQPFITQAPNMTKDVCREVSHFLSDLHEFFLEHGFYEDNEEAECAYQVFMGIVVGIFQLKEPAQEVLQAVNPHVLSEMMQSIIFPFLDRWEKMIHEHHADTQMETAAMKFVVSLMTFKDLTLEEIAAFIEVY